MALAGEKHLTDQESMPYLQSISQNIDKSYLAKSAAIKLPSKSYGAVLRLMPLFVGGFLYGN